jgi:hypothetical protein
MNNFKAQRLLNCYQNMQRLWGEIRAIDSEIKALPKIRWLARRKLEARRKDLRSFARDLDSEMKRIAQ